MSCKRLRFENGPCCAWSIQRDVGQDLRRWTDVPMWQLRWTSGQWAGPRFGWDKPIYLYSRCLGNCLCRVMGKSNILVGFHHLTNIGASRLTIQWEILLKTLLTCPWNGTSDFNNAWLLFLYYSDNGFLLRFFTKGFYYEILIMAYSKWVKLTNYYDLFKVSKMTNLIMTCSKLAKWLIIMTFSKLAVLNKAIQGYLF